MELREERLAQRREREKMRASEGVRAKRVRKALFCGGSGLLSERAKRAQRKAPFSAAETG
jgi:hypothetical protein